MGYCTSVAEDLNSGLLRTNPQTQLAVRAGLELGASELQVQHSNPSATLPLLMSSEISQKDNFAKLNYFCFKSFHSVHVDFIWDRKCIMTFKHCGSWKLLIQS